MTIQERFDAKWTPEPFSGCWLWTGAMVGNCTYGAFSPDKRKYMKAHRFAWILRHGEIPKGMCILHRCDTPVCVNPDHLFLGTITDNNADRAAKGRTIKGVEHHNAKLSPEKVRAIRASSDSRHKLAAKFGVHKSAIQWVKTGRTWKHVV